MTRLKFSVTKITDAPIEDTPTSKISLRVLDIEEFINKIEEREMRIVGIEAKGHILNFLVQTK